MRVQMHACVIVCVKYSFWIRARCASEAHNNIVWPKKYPTLPADPKPPRVNNMLREFQVLHLQLPLFEVSIVRILFWFIHRLKYAWSCDPWPCVGQFCY